MDAKARQWRVRRSEQVHEDRRRDPGPLGSGSVPGWDQCLLCVLEASEANAVDPNPNPDLDPVRDLGLTIRIRVVTDAAGAEPRAPVLLKETRRTRGSDRVGWTGSERV